MKKDRLGPGPPMNDTMRPEYDFSKGQRGVTARRYVEEANVVVILPDVLDGLPDGLAVNAAPGALGPFLRRREV